MLPSGCSGPVSPRARVPDLERIARLTVWRLDRLEASRMATGSKVHQATDQTGMGGYHPAHCVSISRLQQPLESAGEPLAFLIERCLILGGMPPGTILGS